jgi:hypothetical protein
VSECEAERRIKQTLYVMENDWASGSFDYGKVKQMLTGRKDDTCACEAERMSA